MRNVEAVAIILLVAVAGAGLVGRGFVSEPSGEPPSPPPAAVGATPQLCSADGTSGRVADTIVSGRDSDRYGVARDIYAVILADNPQDHCAAAGLAALTTAEAESARPDTWVGRWSETWSATVKAWWKPLAVPLGAAIGAAVLLIVVGRLLTPAIIRPRTTVTTADRRVSRLGATIVIIAVGVAPVLQVLVRQMAPDPRLLTAGVTTLGAAVIALIQVWVCPALGARRHELRRYVPLAVGLAAMGVSAWIQVFVGSSAWWWLWWFGAGVAGVVWVASTRGGRLAVNVSVRKNNVVSDDAAQLLLARLCQLGSEPPRGIQGSPQTDVTALPDDALTAVPGGALASAVFRLYQLVRPGVPWSFNVVLHGDDTVSWQIQRNGVPTETGVTARALADLGVRVAETKPVEQPAGVRVPTGESATKKVSVVLAPAGVSRSADDCLLTCAAAALLLTLSQAHPELKRGLCLAEKWETVATYSLAMTAPRASSARRDLLSQARLLEPHFGLAAFAHTHLLPLSTLTERRTFAKALDKLLVDFPVPVPPPLASPDPAPPMRVEDRPDAGWEALHLRLLHSVAAAWLNVALLTRPGAPEEDKATFDSAWTSSAVATIALVGRLEVTIEQEQLAGISTALRVPTYFVLADLTDLRPVAQKGHDKPADVVSERFDLIKVHDSWTTPVTAVDHFARAAYHAAKLAEEPFLTDLEKALTRPGFREGLETDPSFAALFAPPDPKQDPTFGPVRSKFKSLVGGPPRASFLELAPFAAWSTKLQESGYDQLAELAQSPSIVVATRLGVPHSKARQLCGLARLAVEMLPQPLHGQPSDDIEILGLLIECGVASTDDLRKRMHDSPELLYTELVAAARRRPVVPTREATVTRWQDLLSTR